MATNVDTVSSAGSIFSTTATNSAPTIMTLALASLTICGDFVAGQAAN